ncbi:MAG: N-acetylneuraminate synthase family protein [Treponema sp.]|nr:N-acetylneuraminate synthase family protein [Treponema sp.]
MKKNEKKIKINGCVYDPQNPFIIAELGTSHNSDLKRAKLMIDAAKDSGADCIKVQMVYTDEILHPNTGIVPLPTGNIRLYDRFKSLETSKDFYIEVKNYAESRGILFLCTPFGLKSAKILKELDPKAVKIASPELNFTGLLEEIASWGIPALLSTGVSRLSDIETAVEIFRNNLSQRRKDTKNAKEEENKELRQNNSSLLGELGELSALARKSSSSICLLHCVTAYPAPETDYNLRVLPNLASIFGVSVGVSDHSASPDLIPALSVAMGASAIEKHFCLSRNDPGLDDPIALEPSDFSKMAKAVRRAAKEGADETIARFNTEKGAEFVEQILGNGVKELALSEAANYNRTNRSIHALRDINEGEILKRGDYAVLRTEKILRPGLEPSFEKSIEGRIARNFIPSGEGIRFEDI